MRMLWQKVGVKVNFNKFCTDGLSAEKNGQSGYIKVGVMWRL